MDLSWIISVWHKEHGSSESASLPVFSLLTSWTMPSLFLLFSLSIVVRNDLLSSFEIRKRGLFLLMLTDKQDRYFSFLLNTVFRIKGMNGRFVEYSAPRYLEQPGKSRLCLVLIWRQDFALYTRLAHGCFFLLCVRITGIYHSRRSNCLIDVACNTRCTGV